MHRFILGYNTVDALEALMSGLGLALMSVLGGGIIYALIKEHAHRDESDEEQ